MGPDVESAEGYNGTWPGDWGIGIADGREGDMGKAGEEVR